MPRLTNLRLRLPTMSTQRVSTVQQTPGATPRMRGRRGMQRRERWLREHPLCAQCARSGITAMATVPDHIVPLSKGGADIDSNLQSLCRPCHTTKTASERRGRGKS